MLKVKYEGDGSRLTENWESPFCLDNRVESIPIAIEGRLNPGAGSVYKNRRALRNGGKGKEGITDVCFLQICLISCLKGGFVSIFTHSAVNYRG